MAKTKGITIEEVRRIAALANLILSPTEEKRYAAELSDILEYVSELQRVDSGSVAPYFKNRSQKLEPREDLADYFPARNDLVTGANFKDSLLVTAAIFDHENTDDHQGDSAGA